MYCPKCRKEMAEGAAYCDRCGAQLNSYGQPESTTGGGQNGTRVAIPYNTMCVIGAVISGISLFVPFCGIGGFILSRIGKKQIEETGERGKNLALAGMVIGGVTTGVTAISIIMLLATVLWSVSAFR